MAPRKYRSPTRTRNREQTRERIVKATVELHRERGILDTTHAMIAGRADVSVPTVYNHFPTRGDLVKACGAHIQAGAPPLDVPELLHGRSSYERARALVSRIFDLHAYYAPWSVRVLGEADRVPELAHALEQRRQQVRQLLLQLFRNEVEWPDLALAEVLLDFRTYMHLVLESRQGRLRAEQAVIDLLLHLMKRAAHAKEMR